ncbi:hypothetical protein BC629DRAFT_1091432 [Irpex lacteus]|nr:hypothetical protein BC629DRAFT_1091432 [Irpex lacteus]
MLPFPITPTRSSSDHSMDGHTSSPKPLHPNSRTLLNSPYSDSDRPTRLSPKKQHDDPFSPGFEDADPSYYAQEGLSCSPQRHSLPRYQKRQSHQKGQDYQKRQVSKDPAVSAIRRTYAEEAKVLAGRLGRLSLDERMVWEDLITADASQQGPGSDSFSYASTSNVPQTTSYAVAPLPHSPYSPLVPPSSPAYSAIGHFSSVESSPGVLTPPQVSYSLPPSNISYPAISHFSSAESSPGVLTPPHFSYSLSPYSPTVASPDTGPASLPLPLPPPPPPSPAPPVEAYYASLNTPEVPPAAHDTSDDDASVADIEEQFERELRVFIAERSAHMRKKPAGKEKRDKQIKSSHRNRSSMKAKIKPISAKQVTARMVAFAAQNPVDDNSRSLSFVEGSSTDVRPRAPTPNPPFSDSRQLAVSPPSRRRRSRATEKMIWDGVDSAQWPTGDSKLKRRSTNTPYSKERRGRVKRSEKETPTLSPCSGRSLDGSARAPYREPKPQRRHTKHRASALQSRPLSQTPSMTPQRSPVVSTVNELWDVDDGYQAADEASATQSSESHAYFPYDGLSTALSRKIKEEEEADEVERFLLTFESEALGAVHPR